MIQIRELGDSPIANRTPLESNFSGLVGNFQVRGKEYRFRAIHIQREKEDWTIEFDLMGEHGQKQDITGTGDAPIVFSTVIAYIKEFIAKENPVSFSFLADIEEKSRVKLYNFFAHSISRVIPYKLSFVDTQGWSKYKTYVFTK